MNKLILLGNLVLIIIFFGCSSPRPYFNQINQLDKASKKTGVWVDKDISTNRISFTKFNNDKKDGTFNEYHNNGLLAISGKYKNGLKDGIWKTYTPQGILSSETKYKFGEVRKNKIYNLQWATTLVDTIRTN